MKSLEEIEDFKNFQRLLGTLKKVQDIAVGVEETKEEDFYHIKIKGEEFITIQFKRKYVQFYEEALSTLTANELESFLVELKRQGYGSDYPNFN